MCVKGEIVRNRVGEKLAARPPGPFVGSVGSGGTATDSERFARSDVTWAAYLLLGYFGYLQAVLGPLMPFLRRDLHLSYSAGGLHFSAFAAGMIVAGLSGNRITERLGRPAVFWGGAAGMALGACGLLVGRQVALTIAGAGVMGLLGTLLLVTIQAALSDEHGTRRTQALTESNIMASLCSGLSALFVGLAQGAGLGWRAALAPPLLLLALVAARFWRVSLPLAAPAAPRGRPGADGRLPGLFWIYWAVVVLSVAAEWCVAFWGTDYLQHVVGLDASVAATAMGLYLFVTVVARVGGSRLARTAPSAPLLVMAIGVALAGFLLFWLAPRGPLTIAGLFITALGVANLFPLGLATALGIAPALSSVTSARVSLGAGLAIFVAPLTLGGVADRVGIRLAYGAVPLLLCGAGAAALGALALGRRRRAVDSRPLTAVN